MSNTYNVVVEAPGYYNPRLVERAETAAAQAALYDGPWFDDFSDLLADTTLTYTSGTASSVSVGDWVRIRATGAAFQVMASGATTHDYATAGGVKVMDPSRRFASILSADWQPETEEQVARLRAVLTEMAAFTASYDRQIVDLRILGDLVDRPLNNDGTAFLYGYPQLVTDLASRKLPPLRPLPGNHDVPYGDDDHPTNWSLVDYRRAFGAEFYAVRRGNMIDVYLGDMAGGTSGEQTDEALRWFEALLANAGENNIIVHLHQPLYGTRSTSVAAYNADGFPADPTDIGTAYQFYSERIAAAIEACTTVAAVFYGHVGESYAGSTEVVEQFGTVHIGVQMGLERSQRYADGGANDWPDHYGVLDYTHGQTAALFRRRDAKTGGWISGSDVAITLAYPANLRGDVHDGRVALDRINPTARGVLVVNGDMSDERYEVTPGVWEAVPGVRWRGQFATTEAALDDPEIGDGTGILLGIPGANTDYMSGGNTTSNNLSTRPAGGWGGGIAAVRDRGDHGDLIGRLQFYVQNDVSGAVEDMVVVMESEGDRGTVRFLEGIEPRRLTNADTLAGLRVPDAKYSSTRGMAQVVSIGATASAPADAPAQYVQGLHIQRDDDSASQLLMESGGGGVRLWLNSYTNEAWAGWGLIEALAARSFVTVTASTETVSGAEGVVICDYAGTVTLTLPAAADFPGRQIRVITTGANAVISASSNVIPSLGGSAGTAILPAIAGASCWLVSNGTAWVEFGDVPYVASVTDTTVGRVPTVGHLGLGATETNRGLLYQALQLPSLTDAEFTAGVKYLLLGRVANDDFKLNARIVGGRATNSTTHRNQAVFDITTHKSSGGVRATSVLMRHVNDVTTRRVQVKQVTYDGADWIALELSGSSSIPAFRSGIYLSGWAGGLEPAWVNTSAVSGVTDPGFDNAYFELNNSEIYRRANIVGTVSQSGGVPTGAVIEEGSNANGQYVRFASGLQICTNGNAAITTNPAAFTGTVTSIDGDKLRLGRWF